MRVGGKPFGLIRMLIRQNSVSKTITRSSRSSGSLGEVVESTSSTPTENMWLFKPMEMNIETDGGEKLEGDYLGLALDTADIRVDDEITINSETFEVERVVSKPNPDELEYIAFSLKQVTH